MSLIRRISGDFRHLCKPAMVYLAISVVALVAIAYQNMGLSNMYCMGDFSCYVPSTSAVIFSEGLYILFWTWILNLMCRTGYASISWFMVVFPLVLFFVLIGLMMIASMQMTRQGRVKQMQPIERPVLANPGDFDSFGPLFPAGPRMREGFSRSEEMQRMRKKLQQMRESYPAKSEKRKQFEEEYRQFMRSQSQTAEQVDPMQSDPMQSDPMQSEPIMAHTPSDHFGGPEGFSGGNSHGPPNMRPR